MAIITAMINESKRKMAQPNLYDTLKLSCISLISALLTLYIADMTSLYSAFWAQIPAIGIAMAYIILRNGRDRSGCRTIVESIVDRTWFLISCLTCAMVVLCVLLHLCGYPQGWASIFFFTFIALGFGCMIHGIAYKEPSYSAGGIISIFAGFGLIILSICSIALSTSTYMLIYGVCFTAMFVIPAIVVSSKYKKSRK